MPRQPEEIVLVLMTAAHISPNVFSLRNLLSNIQDCSLQYIIISITLIIHPIHMHIYIFCFTRLIHIFTSSDLHGRLAALGSLCPIQHRTTARVRKGRRKKERKEGKLYDWNMKAVGMEEVRECEELLLLRYH
jgi:hypothetical protein